MDEIKKLYDKTRDLLKKWGVTDEEADDFMKELTETADKNDEEVSEEVEEAKEEIEEKGEDTQSEEDRVDESVGEEKREDPCIISIMPFTIFQKNVPNIFAGAIIFLWQKLRANMH